MNYASVIFVGFFAVTYVQFCVGEEDYQPELNQACRRREDCPEFGYWCNGNMTCQCTSLYIPNRSKTRCVGGVGQKCQYDDDCIERAFCEKQTMCKCKKFSHPTNNGLSCVRNSSRSWKYQSYHNFLTLLLLFVFTKIS